MNHAIICSTIRKRKHIKREIRNRIEMRKKDARFVEKPSLGRWRVEGWQKLDNRIGINRRLPQLNIE